MTAPRKVKVGSQNQVKVECVRQAFGAVWPDTAWDVAGCSVKSGVLEQPLHEQETSVGATNRARAALARDDADFGVGLEGGLVRSQGRWMERGWVVVVNRKGLEGIGATAQISIPEQFYRQMQRGQTLGEICDQEFGTTGIGQGVGYFGLMTNHAVTRTSAYRDAVAFALAIFVHPQLFAQRVGVAGD
jgi:inosine/xanthosine triphosphatase